MLVRIPGLLFCAACVLVAQRSTGEIRIAVTDPSGLPLRAQVEVSSQATHARRSVDTGLDGVSAVKLLPFGPYLVAITAPGFASFSEPVEIRSELPLSLRVQMQLTPVGTTVTVSEAATLLDPHRTGPTSHIGPELIEQRRATIPSRSVLELVETQPGWLLEANGVLHPRGSEYNTQYVIDGIPVTDNRSPGIAPPLEVEELESMTVMTGNYPAEYGRKLGGVVAVTTARDPSPGWTGKAALQGGSFDTASAFAGAQYSRGASSAFISAHGAMTDRYLDPPSLQNFSNRGSNSGLSARFERDWSLADRTRWLFARRRVHFLVPNEPEQEQAGQRQDRDSGETMGQFTWSHILNPSALLHTRLMARDVEARLWSNSLATPIDASQDRGFREFYSSVSLAANRGPHEWKVGGEWIASSVREQFRYRITNPDRFDDDIAQRFSFTGRRNSREASAYVQDLIRAGRLTLSLGLRWDRYRFLVNESAFSPRLGAAWHWVEAGLVLRASYDRAFETPAVENLLLASLSAAALSPEAAAFPVPATRSHFWQAGFSKTLGRIGRLDGSWFLRNTRNYGDDEVLLNTGVSFPIAFSRARIEGVEARLELPRWNRWSGWLSWSNLSGVGESPVTGGLFLEEDELVDGPGVFRITQDQRNTLQARTRFDAHRRLWLSFGVRYGSGLPVELEDDDEDYSHVDSRILERVDLGRGRIRPSYFLDAAAGLSIARRERASVTLQVDGTNLTNRLNVINFSGLFSGTALASPRAVMARLTVAF